MMRPFIYSFVGVLKFFLIVVGRRGGTEKKRECRAEEEKNIVSFSLRFFGEKNEKNAPGTKSQGRRQVMLLVYIHIIV